MLDAASTSGAPPAGPRVAGARSPGERGETLVELLVAMVIMGIAVVAIVFGLATSVLMSDVHRKQTQANVSVRDYAEALQDAVATSQSNYVGCATPADYGPATAKITNTGFSTPSGYTASVVSVAYWDGTSQFVATCPASDTGLQQITLRVSSNDTRATESLTVVLRIPCRPADATCPAS
jgi:prepilin-type N-terminal cleavage/methylation domain-containing protein